RYQSAREFADALRKFREGGEIDDPEATRRTFRRDDGAGDDTRRTAPDDETRRSTHARVVFHDQPSPAIQNQKWPPKKAAKPLPLWLTRAIAAGLGATAILLVWLAGSSMLLYLRGQQLEREIASGQVASLDEIWNRWTELSQGNS